MLQIQIFLTMVMAATSSSYQFADRAMHAAAGRSPGARGRRYSARIDEIGPEFWRAGAQARLREATSRRPITSPAKNLIMFLGDGMSIPTLAAARTYQGQLQGQPGEESQLFFETFPYTGLSKTYCVDAQVADSACSATAYLGGVKANIRTIGVTAAVQEKDCVGMMNEENHVSSLLQWGQDAGKATGIVTTTRVTHASPAGAYAHTAQRDWESNKDMGSAPAGCLDIAQQLVKGKTGKNFKVILGGGRRELLSDNTPDPEGGVGRRTDGQNLIKYWEEEKQAAGVEYQYVWNRKGLQEVDYDKNEYLLGLFESSHMMYHLDTLKAPYNETEPTLSELVTAAILSLQKEKNGFVLFVEGGRIDHAHHGTEAHLALDEAVQMAEAVQTAAELTNEQDTLIVVTADHAHTMSFSGYPDRGNDIFGIAGTSDIDDIPYATLTYANGRGYHAPATNGDRYDVSKDDMHDINYEFPSLTPLDSETHGGDDVAVLARGPWAQLLTGVYEQNYIPHVMAYAACIGSGATVCDDANGLRH